MSVVHAGCELAVNQDGRGEGVLATRCFGVGETVLAPMAPGGAAPGE